VYYAVCNRSANLAGTVPYDATSTVDDNIWIKMQKGEKTDFLKLYLCAVLVPECRLLH